MSDNMYIGGENSIELLAGRHPNGEMIIERVLVDPQSEANCFRLLTSPVFVRGIARDDIIKQLAEPKGAFSIQQHSGNLCVRVVSRSDNDQLQQSLTPLIEKLGGELDVKEPRVLVYSIHVSCGFTEIEKILNQQLQGKDDCGWFYGNVYDPDSGEPLDWWLPILSPQ